MKALTTATITNMIVTPGDPKGKIETAFRGRPEPPPDARVRWNSVRTVLYARRAEGLKAGAPVRDCGVNVGEVEDVSVLANRARIDIVYYATDPAACPYVKEGTLYWVNMAQLSTRGVEGDVTTPLYGAYVSVMVDPLLAAGHPASSFVVQDGPPPAYWAVSGERELPLESAEWIPPGTTIFSQGEAIGYVRATERSQDSRTFYLRSRIYPRGQAQICVNSVFFLQPKVKASLFSARSLLSWEGPQVQVPFPEALLRPGIEVRTPPDSGGQVVWSGSKGPAFKLNVEPREEWLAWQASLPTGETAGEIGSLKLPPPPAVQYAWREDWSVRRYRSTGYVLAVPGGLIGARELLQPRVSEDRIASSTFTVDGAPYPREPGGCKELSEELSFLKLDLGDRPVCSLSSLAHAAAPVDLFVLHGSGAAAIDVRRLTENDGHWLVSPEAGCDPRWHGAPVACAKKDSPAYGKIIGVLLCKDDGVKVVPLPANVEKLLN